MTSPCRTQLCPVIVCGGGGWQALLHRIPNLSSPDEALAISHLLVLATDEKEAEGGFTEILSVRGPKAAAAKGDAETAPGYVIRAIVLFLQRIWHSEDDEQTKGLARAGTDGGTVATGGISVPIVFKDSADIVTAIHNLSHVLARIIAEFDVDGPFFVQTSTGSDRPTSNGSQLDDIVRESTAVGARPRHLPLRRFDFLSLSLSAFVSDWAVAVAHQCGG